MEDTSFNFKGLVFDISDLDHARSGKKEVHEIDVVLDVFEEAKAISHLKGEIILIRTEDTIECVLNKMNVSMQAQCVRCLKDFGFQVNVEHGEGSFFFNEEDVKEEEDFFIDAKNRKLDANELVRQELILHFPIILVCSDGCLGICSQCKKDRNSKECQCDPLPKEETPLSALKEIWNNKQ